MSAVPRMNLDDIVGPGDAAHQALLPDMAQNTHDVEKRDRLLDCILTIAPLTEWPPKSLELLRETCRFVISLSRQLQQRVESRDGGDDSTPTRR
jgi:hypothetical protein